MILIDAVVRYAGLVTEYKAVAHEAARLNVHIVNEAVDLVEPADEIASRTTIDWCHSRLPLSLRQQLHGAKLDELL